jgi:phosphoglycerol transferase MdoB-like AlkP superfamily enzyme
MSDVRLEPAADPPASHGPAATRVLLLALLGAWLVAKQVLWSPLLETGAPMRPGASAAAVAIVLALLGVAVRLGGRAQVIALVALDAALTGIFQVQLLYQRQFSQLASVAALSYASQAATVRGAILALVRPTDALLWADVLLLALALARGVRGARPHRRSGRALLVAGALLFAMPAIPLVRRPLTGPRQLGVSRSEVAATLGIVAYQVFDAVRFVQRRLDRSGRGSLAAAIEYHRSRNPPSGPLTGTQRGRNVIVVQLESMQRFAVGRVVNGVPVTPELDRVARESLAFDQAFSQAAQGTSSDAELAAGCSLYPLETGAVFTERYDIRYRCLPEVLREAGYRAVAMHANWPNFWNRDRMYPAMGYERFFDIRDFDREPVVGFGLSDARFFEQAADRLAALPRPFYASLVTLSNHAPFDDPSLPHVLPLGPLAGTYVGAYLDSVRFADAAFGTFVRRLRATGLLDTSVLVVYGDHAGVSRAAAGTELLHVDTDRPDAWLRHERGIPLLVRLPGGAHRGVRADPAGQVDIAPTIVDLLGLPFERTFFHGRSLVSDAPGPVVLPDGSAITADTVFVAPDARPGGPICLAARSGAPTSPDRCDALAEHAARALATARAEVNQDLFRWMLAATRAP